MLFPDGAGSRQTGPDLSFPIRGTCMIRSALRPLLLLALSAALSAPAARAQDALSRARADYGALAGDWVAPGGSCAARRDTWSFGPGTVRAGTTEFELLGVGAGPGTIRLDLLARAGGGRRALGLSVSGERLIVRGQGVNVMLVPCREAPEPVRPPEVITLEPLDRLPSEDALRERLGGGAPEPSAPADPDLSAEEAYGTRLTGAWRGGDGSCGWRLDRNRITTGGVAYDLVNFSGSAERIGIQALREDGTPATFTLTPGAGGTAGVSWAAAGEARSSDSLTRC